MTETSPLVKLNDGNFMPQLGLGVWKASDGQEVENAVKIAIQTGYRLIDTAMVYQNERGVGKAIHESGVDRKELFITTKLWNSDQGKGKVRPALEASLERLGLDYVDLYLIHWPTPARGLYVETWQEIIKLQQDGLIKSIGVSNFQIEHLEELKKHTSVVPAVNQVELHPYFQQPELREYCNQHGIQVESWSPIGGSKGDVLENDEIINIAHSHAKSPAQIVIRWHLQNGLVVIPKSTNEGRIRENFDVFDFELSADEMSTINSLQKGTRFGADPDTMNNS